MCNLSGGSGPSDICFWKYCRYSCKKHVRGGKKVRFLTIFHDFFGKIRRSGFKVTDRNCSVLPKFLVWVSYPLKQGLKPIAIIIKITAVRVWVSYPLKQGLKRKYRYIRTDAPILSLSQLSIKTRIETYSRWSHRWSRSSVWVSYPLKQGLKQKTFLDFSLRRISLSQLSIKTRIETNRRDIRWGTYQGLSQLSIKTRIETDNTYFLFLCRYVWVSYPLKQGLKQECFEILPDAAFQFESAIH